jgi:hypothetical protein
MSGASDPRNTGLWPDAFLAARSVLEQHLTMTASEADRIAGAVTERLLGDFLTFAEAGSAVMFGSDGTGPWCSWCGKIPGPRLSRGHPQYGVFCDCKRAEAKPEPADESAEVTSGE